LIDNIKWQAVHAYKQRAKWVCRQNKAKICDTIQTTVIILNFVFKQEHDKIQEVTEICDVHIQAYARISKSVYL